MLAAGRILVGVSPPYRDVRPMTSDPDMAIFDEAWLADAAASCNKGADVALSD